MNTIEVDIRNKNRKYRINSIKIIQNVTNSIIDDIIIKCPFIDSSDPLVK